MPCTSNEYVYILRRLPSRAYEFICIYTLKKLNRWWYVTWKLYTIHTYDDVWFRLYRSYFGSLPQSHHQSMVVWVPFPLTLWHYNLFLLAQSTQYSSGYDVYFGSFFCLVLSRLQGVVEYCQPIKIMNKITRSMITSKY